MSDSGKVDFNRAGKQSEETENADWSFNIEFKCDDA